jgi:hypothetical protein
VKALRHPPFYRGEAEEAEAPGLEPGDKHVRVVFPRPLQFRGRITVVHLPVKEDGVGAEPTLGATLLTLSAK